MGTGLELSRISKKFGDNGVLDDISLRVEPGEFVSLVGPSGCGKSTLLRIIAGLELQSSGSVMIGDSNVDSLPPRERNIAMVFQNYALYPHMSAFDNIALPLTVSRLSLIERLPIVKRLSPRRPRIAREIADEVGTVAALLHLEALLARKPGQLSGGQRQRVALARAMVRRPSLFLMDEPLSNLDAQLRVHMRDELADLHQRLGATFVYVTHDQVEAMTMSSRVAMMDQGRLIQVDTPRALYERPQTLAVARFIGSPTMNILDGRIEEGGRIVIAGRPLPLSSQTKRGEQVSIGIRPEVVRILEDDHGKALLKARIRRIEHHGSERLAYLDLAAPLQGTLIARIPGGGVAEDGSILEPRRSVGLDLDATRLHVFDAAGQSVATTPLPVAIDTTPLSGLALPRAIAS